MKIRELKLTRSSALLLVAAICTLACSHGTVSAEEPAASFPSFIKFTLSPEGVAVDRGGNVYVSLRNGENGEIWKFTLYGGRTFFAETGAATIGGLVVDAFGTVYAAAAEGIDRGVYKVEQNGYARRMAGTQEIVFANALTFDDHGNLFVTESYSLTSDGYGKGGIWRISPGGKAGLWLRHDLLTGIGAVLGYPVGANGIAYFRGDLYVANTDKGLVVRIPVRPDGSPGQPDVWAQLKEVSGSPLAGTPFPLMGDGLTLDTLGNVYVAVVSRAAIVRINAEGKSQETIATLPSVPFDTPASLAFGTGKSLFITNLGWMGSIVPGVPWPGPGLVKIDVGIPGLPLPCGM